MEQVYKTALEIILKFCEKEPYQTVDNIKTICEAVLKTEEEKNDNQN